MGFFATIGRGWQLSKLSFSVIKADPELLLYTFLSAIMVFATIGAAAYPGYVADSFDESHWAMTDPVINPETGETRGNPNLPQDKREITPKSQTGRDFSRSEQTSFKGDDTKPFTVSIQDVDEAILFYFENVIRPTVIQNGERIAVPLVYGSPERFSSMQKDGFYRDKKGKIMSPIIPFISVNLITKQFCHQLFSISTSRQLF